jgi:lipid A 3-O-deacylase
MALRIAFLLLAPRPVTAQFRPSTRIQIDNDYFNFWLPAARRPDNDYTQGLVIEIPFNRLRSLIGTTAPSCSGLPSIEARCATGLLTLTQEIYTPEQDATELIPGQRPYSGWLSLGATMRWISPTRMEQVTVAAGVTGPPSLAEAAQKGVHRVLGYREPLGWSGQVPFEPGLVISYEQARMIGEWRVSGVPIVSASVDVRGRLGNVATDARGGACLSLGWNVTRCNAGWPQPHRGLGAGIVAGMHGDIVFHALSLDGSTFAEGPRVHKKAGVWEGMIGVSVHVGHVELGWTAIHRSREYDTQSKGHSFSKISLSF